MKLRKNSIANVDNPLGKVYFYINADGQIIAKCGEKEAIANIIEDVENRKAINVQALGLSVPYIQVPPDVENAFKKAKNSKMMENCYLIYAGKSVLTGKEYFKLNSWVPPEKWDCIEDFFEDFGSRSGRTGELKGWVTCMPEKVEAALGLKYSVRDQKEEIKRQENEAKKFQAAISTIKKK